MARRTSLTLEGTVTQVGWEHPGRASPPIIIFFLSNIVRGVFECVLPREGFCPSPIGSLAKGLVVGLPMGLLVDLVSLIDIVTHTKRCGGCDQSRVGC